MNKTIKILVMNIGNPSVERAHRQAEWLQNRNEDIFFLTETKNSKGCNYLSDAFSSNQVGLHSVFDSYNVDFPKSTTGDYGVMCLSKPHIANSYTPFESNDQYHCRHLENDIIINNQLLHTVCLYVPSRDQSKKKIIRKKIFLEKAMQCIRKSNNVSTIICGDFNIVDRNHIPHYSTFKDWEYKFYEELIELGFVDTYRHCNPETNEHSWVGRTGDGYRYDYCFVSKDMLSKIVDCHFVHETRIDKLTDHSALKIEIAIE